jgi:Flp pilus assembly protein TadB
VDAVAEEMRLTMYLLFLRTDESQGIAEKLFSKEFYGTSRRFGFWRGNPAAKKTIENMRVRRPMYTGHRDLTMKGIFHLRQFRDYRPRLAYLQEQMKTWRPRRFSELFTPGYYDRFTWFIAIFGLVFGIIATLSLVTSIIQVIFAVIGVASYQIKGLSTTACGWV